MSARASDEEAASGRKPRDPKKPRRHGLKSEVDAEAFLVRKGYLPIARNHACRGGELDLVMRDGETIVFVEVRRRRSGAHVGALESVTRTKRRRVVRAATDWAMRAGALDDALRFDVVAVTPGASGPTFLHIVDAFNAADAD